MKALNSNFLSAVSVSYLIAFISYYLQYEGLSGRNGIIPAQISPSSHLHTLISFLATTSSPNFPPLATDVFHDLLAFVSVFLSSLSIVSSKYHHPFLFLFLLISYSTLSSSGSTFYSFQWESLLLETGFISLLLTLLPTTKFVQLRQASSLLPRFLLFKLMYMSGTVKIQANCPTWTHLTALEYHYATQCLPGPLSHHFHQLHPFFNRLSVAATLLIELPCALLVLAPTRAVRVLGMQLQVVLQVMIMLTGNYNFFNFLTVTLCLSCMVEDSNVETTTTAAGSSPQNQITKRSVYSFALQYLITLVLLVHLFGQMFSIGFFEFELLDTMQKERATPKLSLKNLAIHLNLSAPELNAWTTWLIPNLLSYLIIFLSVKVTMITFFKGNANDKILQSVCLGGVGVWICVLAYPMVTLTQDLGGMVHGGEGSGRTFFYNVGVSGLTFGGYIYHNLLAANPILSKTTNNYGLFRSMTGVAHSSQHKYINNDSYGWANLPPSMVERPEIILEGNFGPGEGIWRELNFKYKPGNLFARPKQVAPYQPRLDWQMWFAALSGNYQQSPWVVSLIDKLLDNVPSVVELMDENDLSQLNKIRAFTHDYDFTRTDTEWNRRIPGVKIIDQADRSGRQYWTRKNKREYLGEVEKNNESVKSFLSAHRLGKGVEGGDGQNLLRARLSTGDNEDDELIVEEICGKDTVRLCRFFTWVRLRQQIWTPVIVVFGCSAVLVLKSKGWWFKGKREYRWGIMRTEKEKEGGNKNLREKKVKFA